MKMRNMPTAISATSPMVPRDIRPTEVAALESTSMGLNRLTIILDIRVLVCSSSIFFFVNKKPAPIMISSDSIWKNTVKIVMGLLRFQA